MSVFGKIFEVGIGIGVGVASSIAAIIDGAAHIAIGVIESTVFAIPSIFSDSAAAYFKHGLLHTTFGIAEEISAFSTSMVWGTPIQYVAEDNIDVPIVLDLSGRIWTGPHTDHPFSYEEFAPVIDKHVANEYRNDYVIVEQHTPFQPVVTYYDVDYI